MADPKDDKSEKDVSADPSPTVWRRALDSGRHIIDSATGVLRRLDVPGLRLEEDETGPRKQAGNVSGPAGSAKGGGGYDPYGSKLVNASRHPAAIRPASAARTPVRKPVAALPTRRSWWRRLFGG
jgi:hypothetical protein